MAHKMNPDDSIAWRSAEQILTASTFWGRTRLRVYAWWRRAAWRLTTRLTRLVKRTIDLLLATALLALLGPFLLGVAWFVRRDGGPAFFKQCRVGLKGREFSMLKFRSMSIDAESRLAELQHLNEKQDGITFKIKDDPRITPIGRFIRKASIDELPQLLNVIKGEMSLVGPRPPLPCEVAHYSVADRRRLLVKPGITCLWQIGERNGGLFEVGNRNAIDFPEQVALDVRYIENQSFISDCWILLKTIPAVLMGRGGA